MFLPHSYVWTPLQKRLIVAATVCGLAACGILIYCYEHYYRGPDDSALFGTWVERRPGLGIFDPEEEADPIWNGVATIYYRLNPDHTFEFLTDLADDQSAFFRGTWHAGGDVVYLKLHGEDVFRKLIFWRIENLSPGELEIRYNPGGPLHTFNRVRLASPNTSNQSLQLTAGRSDASRRIMKTQPFQTTLAPASGS
jgi:hypothetical protein